jgi:hypothetical protein
MTCIGEGARWDDCCKGPSIGLGWACASTILAGAYYSGGHVVGLLVQLYFGDVAEG